MNHYSTPSRTQVDRALALIDEETERREQAIKAFYVREEAAKPVVHWKLALVGLFCGGMATCWVLWHFVITPFMDKLQPVLERLGIGL